MGVGDPRREVTSPPRSLDEQSTEKIGVTDGAGGGDSSDREWQVNHRRSRDSELPVEVGWHRRIPLPEDDVQGEAVQR